MQEAKSEDRQKLFKDPVHGYISVPLDWCTDFIDTPIFQRLRHIEQTSMRPLYPAARHDRFIHSLGTYHLARKFLSALTANTRDEQIRKHLESKSVKNTFLIAALMHDCGHAPFSHTFEAFYNYSEAKSSRRAYDELANEFPDSDFKVGGSFDPAPHEAFSAIILNRFYREKLESHECDVELAARMITGCTYPEEKSITVSISNCLIELLNGKAIDVDKLDYILRDTWASGVQNTAIDIERLSTSVTLHRSTDSRVILCYRKSALSVLQNVVNARNYLYEWVYNHHTILYYSTLLERLLKKMAKHLAVENDPDSFWKSAFSLAPFKEPVNFGKGMTLYLPTDGDILHLLKYFSKEADLFEDLEELLSHSPKRTALWKTKAEFQIHFKGTAAADSTKSRAIAQGLPQKISEKYECSVDDIIVINTLSKYYIIKESHVFIQINEEPRPFTEVMGKTDAQDSISYFYLYVSDKIVQHKTDVIQLIRSMVR